MQSETLRVLIYHPEIIPPKNYGGVERVVAWLAKGLAELGVRVTVASRAGSNWDQSLIKFWSLDRSELSPLGFVRKNLENILKNFDLVHFMFPPGEETVRLLGHRYLVTVHGNGKQGEVFPNNTNFLSKNHAMRHGSLCYIYNGVDPSEFEFSRKDYSRGITEFLFFSKTTLKSKNLTGAIRVVLSSGKRLKIAGGNRPVLLRIRSLVSDQIKWIGPITGSKKAKILSDSEALIFPVNWEEPFGLVMIEALMSGTPVIALARGSIPEIINDSRIGKVFNSEDELKYWIKNSAPLELDSDYCRKIALDRFHYNIMAKSYLNLYLRILRGEM